MTITATVSEIQHAHVQRGLIIAKVYYFAFFAALGAIIPFFNVYLQERGLSGVQIGLIASIPPLISMASNPFWSGIADRWQAHRVVLALLAFVAGSASLVFLRVDAFWPILIVLSIVVFFRTPISAILDGTVMGIATVHPWVSYPRQRVWGPYGWVLSSFAIGFLVTWYSLDAIFWIHGLLLAVVCALLSLRLPVAAVSERVDYVAGLRTLTREHAYLGLLATMVLFGAASACLSNFSGLNILRLGGDARLISLTNTMAALLEVPVMLLSHHWFRRVSYRNTIVVTLSGFAAVLIVLSRVTVAWQIPLVTSLIGVFFGLMWTAIVNVANSGAPDGMRATSQGIAQAAHGGLGWALGSAISGILWDWGSGPAVFTMGAVFAATAAGVFWGSTRKSG
jgi:PPP family 3-phenylpropionic acid transporter